MAAKWFVIALLAGSLGLFSATVQGADEKIDLAKVPAVVKQAADHAAPGVTWTKATKEVEDGKTIYELVGKDAKGREVEVEVTPQGKVIEVETHIPMSEVPATVTDAFKAKYPGQKVTDTEAVSKDGKVVAYDFATKLKGKDVEVRVSADGKTFEVEEAEDEKP